MSESRAPDSSASREPGLDFAYLAVFEHSSYLFRLPDSGEVLVGSSREADVRLSSATASPAHARILVQGGTAQVVDLGSPEGTRVNGERFTGQRPLVSGDRIGVGSALLVFHGPAADTPPGFLAPEALRQRAAEEVERSVRSGRSFSVLVVDLGPRCADPAAATRIVRERLRTIDLATWAVGREVVALLPEADGEGARTAAERLVAALAAQAPGVRVGLATCPSDGFHADALLDAARGSLRAGRPLAVAAPAPGSQVLCFGEREALVSDPVMVRVFALAERLARADVPVLISGETGVGKELAAAALHHLSARREEPFVCFNCATIPDTLVESELFGYERGAFTNAVTAKQGLIESATGGTLFLDEVAELPAATQAKLLRVLENKRLRPLGEVRERPVDVRVVTATNRDIEEDVRAGRFRKDLYFRLRGAALWIPPLRERRGEIVLLARAFLDRACARLGRGALEISAEAIAEMEAYAWPGNVRELQSFIDYTAAIAKGDVLERGSLAHWLGELAPPSPRAAAAPGPTARAFRPLKEELRDLERERIADALAATGGNQTRAAELLKMPIRTLLSKVKTYGLVAGSKTKR